MSHVPRSLSGALNPDEFVGAPERSVDEYHVAGFELLDQLGIEPRNCGHEGESFARGRFDNCPERRFLARELRFARRGDVSRKVRSERECSTAQSGVFAFGIREREACAWSELDPADLVGNALQHRKHGIVFGQDAANRLCGVNAKWLKFAEQKKSEDVIDVGVEENGSSDGRIARYVFRGAWMKFGSRFDLRAEIGRSSEQKPALGVGADGKLRLRSSFPAERSGAQRAAIGAGAIPLGKASASGGTENSNLHEASLAAEEIFLIWEILLVGNPPPSPSDLWNH